MERRGARLRDEGDKVHSASSELGNAVNENLHFLEHSCDESKKRHPVIMEAFYPNHHLLSLEPAFFSQQWSH